MPPMEPTSPILQMDKPASSYDVIEGAGMRIPRTQAHNFRDKSDRIVVERMVATDSNFYCSQDDNLP